ncbi:MAG: hypothetical protein JWR07_331 [Nevskia sp.]|nr:hypothetical protein [Nevskia sp.]
MPPALNCSISVALATFNGERFLAEQLESLQCQTLLPEELVLCDDGSTDRTLEIAAEFSSRARFPVRIHRNPQRLGYRNNFLNCVAQCSGAYVALCDQDDVWHERKLEQVALTFAGHSDVSLVIHQGAVSDSECKPTGGYYPRCDRFQIVAPLGGDPWLNVPGFSMTFARKLFEALPWSSRPADPNVPREMLAHDQWIYFLAHTLGATAMLPATLVNYRRHQASVTAVQNRRKRINPWRFPRRHTAEKLMVRQEELRHTSAMALAHADFLAGLAENGDQGLSGRLAAATAYYRRLSTLYDGRSRLCGAALTFRQRFAVMTELMDRKAYAPFALGGIGGKSELIRDFRYLLLGAWSRPRGAAAAEG